MEMEGPQLWNLPCFLDWKRLTLAWSSSLEIRCPELWRWLLENKNQSLSKEFYLPQRMAPCQADEGAASGLGKKAEVTSLQRNSDAEVQEY